MNYKSGLPLTLYDVFGYLIPGAIFCLGALFILEAGHLPSLVSDLKLTASTTQPYAGWHILKLADAYPIATASFLLLVFYLAGHLISSLSSFLLERVLVKRLLRFPSENMLSDKIRVVKLFGDYTRPLPKEIRTRISSGLRTHFGLAGSGNEKELWHLSFCAVEDAHPTVYSRALHFLTLYGFYRNLSMTVLLLSLVAAIVSALPCCGKAALIASLLLSSLAFFWQYLKSFRRMTDEVFRTMYYHHIREERQTQIQYTIAGTPSSYSQSTTLPVPVSAMTEETNTTA